MAYITDAAKEYAKKMVKDSTVVKHEFLDNPKLAYEKYINMADEYNASVKIINEHLKKLYELNDIRKEIGISDEFETPLEDDIADEIKEDSLVGYLSKMTFDEFVEEQHGTYFSYFHKG